MTAAGFLLASKDSLPLGLLLATLIGTALIIASACVVNNYLDREIDAKMARTQKRALVSGEVQPQIAIIYAIVLGILGFGVLLRFTNVLTALLGLVGYISYVFVYGYAKRHSVYGTIVGSVAGAIPPVAGYTAVTNHVDTAAWLLFVILVCWQMPHFYAIAIYRLKDYRQAGLPVWPVKRGIPSTKVQITLFTAAFLIATVLLTVFKYTGYSFLIIMGVAGAWWLWHSLAGFKTTDSNRWARQMFIRSLKITLLLAVMLSIGGILP